MTAKKRKERLDVLMVERGLVNTRSRAQALILAGEVQVNGQTVTKAGTLVTLDDNASLPEIMVKSQRQWASRGAHKLLRAFEVFGAGQGGLYAAGRVCADIGASTGGFTDVLLEHGAQHVYAIDVGYGQLLWRLANDPRVTVMDRTNARNLTRDDFESFDRKPVTLVVCDASFISLKLILPAIDAILPNIPDTPVWAACACVGHVTPEAVVLIKPQFEVGRERVGKGGVVRDPALHSEVLRDIVNFVRGSTNLHVAGLTWSPILGPAGNVEFLCWLTRFVRDGAHSQPETAIALNFDALVTEAHAALKKHLE